MRLPCLRAAHDVISVRHRQTCRATGSTFLAVFGDITVCRIICLTLDCVMVIRVVVVAVRAIQNVKLGEIM